MGNSSLASLPICAPLFRKFQGENDEISITKMIHLENTSDLERAPGAHSIADEFLGGLSIVNELQNCENTAFHIHAPPFGIRSQCEADKQCKIVKNRISTSTGA